MVVNVLLSWWKCLIFIQLNYYFGLNLKLAWGSYYSWDLGFYLDPQWGIFSIDAASGKVL